MLANVGFWKNRTFGLASRIGRFVPYTAALKAWIACTN